MNSGSYDGLLDNGSHLERRTMPSQQQLPHGSPTSDDDEDSSYDSGDSEDYYSDEEGGEEEEYEYPAINEDEPVEYSPPDSPLQHELVDAAAAAAADFHGAVVDASPTTSAATGQKTKKGKKSVERGESGKKKPATTTSDGDTAAGAAGTKGVVHCKRRAQRKDCCGHIKDNVTITLSRITCDECTRAVLKATTRIPKLPPEKHFLRLINATKGAYTWGTPSEVNTWLVGQLESRLHTYSWVVVLKTMLAVHRLLVDGTKEFIQAVANAKEFFDARRLKNSWDNEHGEEGQKQKPAILFIVAFNHVLARYRGRYPGFHPLSGTLQESMKEVEQCELSANSTVRFADETVSVLSVIAGMDVHRISIDNFVTAEMCRLLVVDAKRLYMVITRLLLRTFTNRHVCLQSFCLDGLNTFLNLFRRYMAVSRQLQQLFESLRANEVCIEETLPVLKLIPEEVSEKLVADINNAIQEKHEDRGIAEVESIESLLGGGASSGAMEHPTEPVLPPPALSVRTDIRVADNGGSKATTPTPRSLIESHQLDDTTINNVTTNKNKKGTKKLLPPSSSAAGGGVDYGDEDDGDENLTSIMQGFVVNPQQRRDHSHQKSPSPAAAVLPGIGSPASPSSATAATDVGGGPSSSSPATSSDADTAGAAGVPFFGRPKHQRGESRFESESDDDDADNLAAADGSPSKGGSSKDFVGAPVMITSSPPKPPFDALNDDVKRHRSPPPQDEEGAENDELGLRQQSSHSIGSAGTSNATGDRFVVLTNEPVLGRGGFGTVYKAWDSEEGRHLACKQIEIQSKEAMRELFKEYSVLTNLRHPHIVGVVAFGVRRHTGSIFMEWVPSGSVQAVLKQQHSSSSQGKAMKNLKLPVIRRYIRQTLSGLAYLHANSIVHRDIKPGNMLLDSSGDVKLTDFGTARVLTDGTGDAEGPSQKTANVSGTVPYMSPECFRGVYSAASDVWSVGCTALHLFTGHVPWKELGKKDNISLIFHIGSLQPPNHAPQIGPDPTTGAEAPAELRDFLAQCFVFDHRQRPSAAQLLKHPFIMASQPPSQQKPL